MDGRHPDFIYGNGHRGTRIIRRAQHLSDLILPECYRGAGDLLSVAPQWLPPDPHPGDINTFLRKLCSFSRPVWLVLRSGIYTTN